MNIEVGKPVPFFKLQDEDENIVSSDSLKGQKYVLFFYPKDDSPGCTKEACSIRDNFKYIKRKGYTVFGISPDKSKKHRKFIDKYEFQYSLLADTEKEMILSFGLWGPKKFMGREIVGVYRTTVLVDEKGIVEHIIEKVVTKSHGEQVLEAIKELESEAEPSC
ncbi:MAG: thioredoxin-dependent thiol peroxidase [Saprospiraceae bacterium]|nr:thioredoxin-dependent thiol peroxidase [Saprospiraceae bacterium]